MAAAESATLLLAPAFERGWFGGTALVATDPVSVRSGVPLAEAAAELEAAFEAEAPALVAVLATYGGECTVLRYDLWRSPRSSDLPASERSEASPLLIDAAWDMTGRSFRAGVEDVRERIASGDVYVLNLTARLTGALAVPTAPAAFSALRGRASADMAAYLGDLPGEVPWIASVSPERFVRVRSEAGARLVEVCPIKGTRPRGATPVSDAMAAFELAEDEKERAEHVMVVDLERNDLGVVCMPGTVRVEPLYEVVQTPYCHQLVSTVRGTLREDATFAELLAAMFPCGSVTGAPKRAAIRIAGEVEFSERRAYCGALLVAMPGEMDSSVLIRTLEGDATEVTRATWGAGCGITFDSNPAAEHLEALLKASPVTGDGPPAVALRETIRVVLGNVPLLDRHLARLSAGGCGPSVLSGVRAAVATALEEADPAAHYGRLGVTVHESGEVAAELSARPSTLAVVDGPMLIPVAVAEAPALPPGAAKPADRSAWDEPLGAVSAMLGPEVQPVLVAPDGSLIDGATATLWLVEDGVLLTPHSPPAVAGVARELVFDLAADMGIDAEEREITLAQLEHADEVFFSNAVAGVVAARARGGRVSTLLAEAFERVWLR